MLRPADHISSMWLILLRDFLQYLPRSDSSQNEENEAQQTSSIDQSEGMNHSLVSLYLTSFIELTRSEMVSLQMLT